MNKQEIEQQIKCIEVALKSHENGVKVSKEKLVELKEQLETVGKRWKPKAKECYYYKDSIGRCDSCLCDNPYSFIVNDRFKQGNCFKTEAECLKSIARDEAEQELLDMCDFQDAALGIKKGYEIVYELEDKRFFWNWFQYNARTQYRFASEESCQKAIDTLGVDKLKLIFRIED